MKVEGYKFIPDSRRSMDPAKPSHRVPRQLQAAGFRIIPVHPSAEELLGERTYHRLADIPEPIDVVEVFRPPEEAPGIAREAVVAGAGALWLQLGLRSEEARVIAEAAGLDYIEDHCMGIEQRRHRITKASLERGRQD